MQAPIISVVLAKRDKLWFCNLHLMVNSIALLLVLGLGYLPRINAESKSDRPSASLIPEHATGILPKTVDLRPTMQQWGLVPRTQGKRPTCSVFTVVGALEYGVARKQGQTARLSVEFLNWAGNQVVRGKQDGGFFSDLWKGFAGYGICTESEYPYLTKFNPDQPPDSSILAKAKERLSLDLRWHWIKEWDVKTGLATDHLQAIKRTLSQGWPVCGGFRWPKQAKWEEGVLQMCPPEAVYDGHSVLLVGYRDESKQSGGGVFFFRNTSGDGRDGAMPYAYAQAYMNDVAWVDYP